MRRETVLKIVGLFRKNLGKGFTILEISKLLKIGYRPAYNHIIELEEIKAITTKKIGSAKQCSMNLENVQSRHFLQEVDLVRIEEFKKMLKSKEMNVGKESKEYGIALYGSEQFWRFIAWQE